MYLGLPKKLVLISGPLRNRIDASGVQANRQAESKAFLFHFSLSQLHPKVLPIFRMSLPAPHNLTQRPSACVQQLVSELISNVVRLTTKINHHNDHELRFS